MVSGASVIVHAWSPLLDNNNVMLNSLDMQKSRRS